MVMSNLAKVGYILVGVGIGVFATTLYYKHELDKPIDVEDYIPSEDREDDNRSEVKSSNDISNSRRSNRKSSGNHTEYYEEDEAGYPSYQDGIRSANQSDNENQFTRYSRMYSNMGSDLGYSSNEDEATAHPDEEPYHPDYDEEPDDDDAAMHDTDLDLPRERVEPHIEIFANENPQDFVPLVYYMGDESLTDDREQLIPNAEEVVGRVALDRLIRGGQGVIDDVIYVRNVKTHINYEIVLDAGSYSETVLGLFESRRNGGRSVSGNGR